MIWEIISGKVRNLENRIREINNHIGREDYGKEILLLKLKNKNWKREDADYTIKRLQRARDSYYFSNCYKTLDIEDIIDGKGKERLYKDRISSIYEQIEKKRDYSLEDIDSMKYVLARIIGDVSLKKRKDNDKELEKMTYKLEERLISRIIIVERRYRIFRYEQIVLDTAKRYLEFSWPRFQYSYNSWL